MKTVNFVAKPKIKHMSKHERHEAREGVYGEYEEEIKKCAKRCPQNPKVKSASLWTLHGKGK